MIEVKSELNKGSEFIVTIPKKISQNNRKFFFVFVQTNLMVI